MSTDTNLSESASDTSGVRIPPFFEFVAIFLIGVGLQLLFPTSSPPPSARIAVTIVAGAAWLALDLAAVALFGFRGTTIWPNWRANPARTLVTSGPYRISRNPQYLGIGCLYFAVAFASGVIWALALLPAMLIYLDRAVIPREERYLERIFGEKYCDYKAQVRRWL